MSPASIIDLMRQRIGLDPESIGLSAIASALAGRMRALNLTESDDYSAQLSRDSQEFQLLLAAIVVPETWFFRGGELFDYLAAHVAEVARLRANENPLRILSIACSTGEEPFSLAIALNEKDVSPAFWHIDAIDISARSVELATHGRFGNFSFRQTRPALRDRYFRPVDAAWELDGEVRGRVSFRQGNVLDPLFLASEACFDIILCRNLFIYMHADARRIAMRNIVRLLASDGMLCMGHSDPVDLHNTQLTPIEPKSYFLYRRGDPAQPMPVLASFDAPPPLEKHTARPAAATPAPREPAPLVDQLASARQHADCGRLANALASCQELVHRDGPSADLYSLMGVIHQSLHENDEAARCYQKALYLAPAHAEALTHLMLLFQEQGADLQADRLRRRLERATQGEEA